MRRFTAIEHVFYSLVDQKHAYRCDVCGFTTENTTGVVHWLRWVGHDLTVGWGPKHWSGYGW